MLEQFDRLPQYQPQPYPISLWRIGDAITWVGLGGEGPQHHLKRSRGRVV